MCSRRSVTCPIIDAERSWEHKPLGPLAWRSHDCELGSHECARHGLSRTTRMPIAHFGTTENVAEGVTVWFRFLSTTVIRSVYDPVARLSSGSHFSTVT